MAHFHARFTDEAPFAVSFENVIKVADFNIYDGAYEITPTDDVQILETAEKLLKENVVVQPIPQNYGHISFNGYSLKVY